MLTATEITAGALRLTANKLKTSDQETLLTAFRLYLKNRAAWFPDMAERLANATDTVDVKTASKLAAVLVLLENSGFAVAELSGGRSGLKFREMDELAFRVRFALALLGYELPEDFSGNLAATGTSYESPEFAAGSVENTIW